MKNLFIATLFIFSGIAVSAQKNIRHKTPEEILNEQYCKGLFRSTDGTILDLSGNMSAISYFNILEWLQGRVAGLEIVKTRTGTLIPLIRGQQSSIYVDEMPVSASYLNALPTSDIAMIKIIKTPFMGGFNGGGGAIAIYTVGVDDGGGDAEEEAR